jgi:hypothetical protein
MVHSHMINFCMYFHIVIDYINFSIFLSGAVDYLCRDFATVLWCSLYQGTLDTCYPGLAYHQTIILHLTIKLIIAISLCCTLLKCASAQIFVSIIENSWALDIIFFFENWLIVFLYATLSGLFSP